jgi:hypothetical protein
MAKAGPRTHLWMPDGVAVVCDAPEAKRVRVTWVPTHATCPQCCARLRKFPQLAPQIQAARQLTIPGGGACPT